VASEDVRLDRLTRGWTSMGNRTTLRNQAVTALLESGSWQEQRTASLVVGKIRVLEGPDGWPELFPGLLSVLDNAASPPHLRRGVLTCSAIIAEDVEESDIDQGTVNSLLTHAVKTLQPDVTDRELQISGVECLLALLEFCEPIFTEVGRKGERDFLVDVFVRAAGHPDRQVRTKALTGLTNMVRWYYAAMPEYMSACHAATDRVIKAIEDEGALDGIAAMDFWAVLGEKEAELHEEGAPCHDLLTRIAPTLAPVMWTVLTTKRDAADPTPTSLQTDTTAAHCASEVLRQIVLQMGPAAIHLFLPLVDSSFAHADWRVREGALSILGFLCEAVEDETAIGPIVAKYFPIIMGRLAPSGDHEADPRIRPPLVWCAAMMLDGHFDSAAVVNGSELISHSLAFFVASLAEAPVTASKAAFAISCLARSASRSERPAMGGLPAGAWITPSLASSTLRALVTAMSRADGTEVHLTVDAMDSFGDFLDSLEPECIQVVVEMLAGTAGAIPAVGGKLVAATPKTPAFNLLDQQLGCLCGTLCFLVAKFAQLRQEVGPAAAAIVAEGNSKLAPLVGPLVAVAGLSGATANTEGWRALGPVISALGREVAPAVATIGPLVDAGLKAHTNPEVCLQAVFATSALVNAMEEAVTPYLGTFFSSIKGICDSDDADPMVKPEAIGCIGDMAGAVGPGPFAQYIPDCTGILGGAEAAAKASEEDDLEWSMTLRHRVLNAYSGILTTYIGADPAASETAPRPPPPPSAPSPRPLHPSSLRPRRLHPRAEANLRGIGQQAVRMARTLANDLPTMPEASRSRLEPDYVSAMCTTIW